MTKLGHQNGEQKTTPIGQILSNRGRERSRVRDQTPDDELIIFFKLHLDCLEYLLLINLSSYI